jgi:integrase
MAGKSPVRWGTAPRVPTRELVKRETKLREARDRFNEWREKRGLKPLPQRTEEFVDHLRPMTLLALNTGLRRGELFQLRWSDLDTRQRLITVRGEGAKSGQTRRTPLNDEALSVLQAWHKQHAKADADDFVFKGRGGALTRIDTAWESLMKLAKVKGFRFHDCRHDFASRLVMAGVPLNTVRELLGHASLEMTLRYGHLAPHHLHTAVAALERA